jgi:broad specificity phosphatase PhoE
MSVALFLRHGKASAFNSSAGYDELSPPGVEQSERFGGWLAGNGPDGRSPASPEPGRNLDGRSPASPEPGRNLGGRSPALREPGRDLIDAVFVGPRKRHAQTLAAVDGVLVARGLALPAPVVMPELDEHDGISLVFKLLPSLGAEDPQLAEIVTTMARGESPAPDAVLSAFRRITRRWVRGEIGHPDVEAWSAFRARVARALDRIASIGEGKRALVVTSAGTVAAATAEVLDVRDEERVLDLSFALYNASLTELDFSSRGWGLRVFNSTAHLNDRRLVTGV